MVTNRKKMTDAEIVEYYIYESSCGYGKEAIEVIAKTTGRTEDEVIELLHANGVAKRFKTGKDKKKMTKLTAEGKACIREQFANGANKKELAKKYGVSEWTIWDITKTTAKKEQPEPIPAVQTVEENVSAGPECCTSSTDIIAETDEIVKTEQPEEVAEEPETAAIPEEPEEEQENFTVFSDEFRAELRRLAERYGGSLRKLEVDYDAPAARMNFKCGPYELVVAVR